MYPTDSWSLYNETSDGIDLELNIIFLVKISNIFHCIISALGIIGNGLVIWIAGFRMKKTISVVWFLNLAIADFLCCSSLPLRIAQWDNAFHGLFENTYLFCKISIILFTANMSASILLLTTMSIDRCISIMWPFWAKVHRTRRLVRITAGGIWGLSLLFSGLAYYLYEFHEVDVNDWCVFNFYIEDSTHLKPIQLIRLVIMFVIPFLIILTSYVIIFIKIRKSKRPRRSQRPYRIITAVILCFFICWSPYYIWPLIPLYDRYHIEFHIANTTFIILAIINSCLNPIIYVFIGQGFRHGFLRSIPARVKAALSEHPADLCGEPENALTTDL